MLEQRAVEAAANTAAAEQQRLDAELSKPVGAMSPDPYRQEPLEPDIEPPQEVHFRARHEAIPHGDSVWDFVRDGRRFSYRPRGRFTADNGAVELAGVVAGLGVAAMPAFLAGPAIERGEVVTILDDYEIPPAGVYVVRPPPAEPVPMKVKVLTDILLEKFGNPGWDRCRRAA